MLSAESDLPFIPQRVLVAGVSGSGKTTLAGNLARILGVEHTEIDALFHGENWMPRPSFAEDVAAVVATDGWVVEWQYESVRQLLGSRAQLLVWLDYPTWLTMWRVTKRTALRSWRREELWNGNYEAKLATVFTDKDHIIRWAWQIRNKYRQLVPTVEHDYPDVVVVRLRNHRESQRFLEKLRAGVVR